MTSYAIDPQGEFAGERYAVIHTPRRGRKRYPEGCIQVVPTADDAIAAADPSANLHPALVYGPSPSSEGLRVYFLVRWLDEG